MSGDNEQNDATRESMRMLMSGYLDGELEPDEHARFEAYVQAHPEFQHELEEMRALVDASAELRPEPVPDEVWDTFLDGVYNRVERRTGWSFLIIGLATVLSLALYWLVITPWASTTVKVIAGLPVVGLLVLFGSVLRERLFMRKTDRYSRDVKR